MIFYPWDNIIKNTFKPILIGARLCILKIVSIEDTIDFLNLYHYQKTCRGLNINLGLYYNNILVGVMCFGAPRYNKKFQWELLRLCFHPSYKISGGSEKLWNYFINIYTPHSVVSYCDKSKFTGKIYEKLNLKKITTNKSRPHYWNGRQHFTSIELLKYGADNLIGTKDGKGANNHEIMLREGFEVIMDQGQDVWLYLDQNQYFGYIYLTTNLINGKQYVGMKTANVFDEKYYGSGRLISRAYNKHPMDFKVEVLEWCKQDLAEKEIEYILKFNTLAPNGYNLTLRKQNNDNFNYTSQSILMQQWAKTKKGKQFYKENSQRLKDFYATEEGKNTTKQIIEKRKLFNKTEEGIQNLQKRAIKYSEFCKTEKGQKMCENRRKKQIALNQTEYGKEKEEKRINKLRIFYQSEEGKLAKHQQINKARQNPNYKTSYQKRSRNYSEWAKTEEGQKILKEGAQRANITRTQNYITFVNSFSDEDWEKYIKEHPKTTLQKYRK